jgi:hypothetical protein
MQEKIGFFRGLGMAWTAAIGAVVKMFTAVERGADAVLDVATSAKNGTEIMLIHSEGWKDEQLRELEAQKAKALSV